MNTQDVLEEQEIDLLDFLRRFLEQWRGWLSVGILCAVLIPAVMYGRDMSSYRAQVAALEAAATEKTPNDQVREVMITDEMSAALIAYARLEQSQTYAEQSVLMKHLPRDFQEVTFIYGIEDAKTPSLASALVEQYSTVYSSEILCDAVGGAIGESGNPFLYELANAPYGIKISSASMDTPAGEGAVESDIHTFHVDLLLPVNTDLDAVEAAVTNAVQVFGADLQESVGAHQVKLLRRQTGLVDLNAFRTKQLDVFNQVLSDRSAYMKAYDAIKDPEQKARVDELVSETGMLETVRKLALESETENVVISAETGDAAAAVIYPAKPGLGKKYVAIGFVAGIFLYGCCFLGWFVLVHRMRREEELQESMGLRNFGGVYEYPYKGFARFLHDKRIYVWRHKKAGAVSDAVQRVSDGFDSRVKYEELQEISFVSLGTVSPWMEGSIESWKKSLASLAQVHAVSFAKPSADLRDEDLLGMAPAIVAIPSGISFSEILNFLSRCRDYKVPVLGTVFLEGPQ